MESPENEGIQKCNKLFILLETLDKLQFQNHDLWVSWLCQSCWLPLALAHPSLSFPDVLIQENGIFIPFRQSLINMCKKLQSPKGKGQRGQSFSCNMGQNRTRTQKRIINVRSFSPEQRHGGRKPSHPVYAKHKLLGRCSRICHQRPRLGNRRAALCWGVSRAGGHK